MSIVFEMVFPLWAPAEAAFSYTHNRSLLYLIIHANYCSLPLVVVSVLYEMFLSPLSACSSSHLALSLLSLAGLKVLLSHSLGFCNRCKSTKLVSLRTTHNALTPFDTGDSSSIGHRRQETTQVSCEIPCLRVHCLALAFLHLHHF
jgi:hypothetical protein